MTHARRYFEKALDNDQQAGEHALKVMQSLYALNGRPENNTWIVRPANNCVKNKPPLYWKVGKHGWSTNS